MHVDIADHGRCDLEAQLIGTLKTSEHEVVGIRLGAVRVNGLHQGSYHWATGAQRTQIRKKIGWYDGS